MKNTFIKSLLLATCLLSSIVAYAYDFQAGGIYYNKLSDNQVEVTYLALGRANADAYVGDVVIPATVTHEGTTYDVTTIGTKAFDTCRKATSITLPQSIVKIDAMAFMNCTEAKSINVPDSVKELGEAAFSGCWALTAIHIPEGITTINSQLCNGCKSLTEVRFPDSVISIGKASFSGCESLSSVTIPDSVTTICERAFSSCKSLKSINLPNTLSVIKDRAFANSGLTAVKIPDGITAISATAFHECDNLDLNKIEFANNGTRGEENGYQWVDLGLPSGKKWATLNVGASSVEQTGDFFAWGETEAKSYYEEKASKANGVSGNIGGKAEYDAAAAHWGGDWRMPTIDEWRELAKYCRWENRTINGREVKRIISKSNGNFIYLPHSGKRILDTHKELNVRGYYWSSSALGNPVSKAQTLAFFSTGPADYSSAYLGVGMAIRAIRE